MKASLIDTAKQKLERNENLEKTIAELSKADLNDFIIEHRSLSKVRIPNSIARKLRASLVQHYRGIIVSNRADVRLMGIDPDQ